MEKLDYEAKLLEFKGIVEKLEQGDVSLKEALSLFERGKELSKELDKELKDFAGVVEKLTSDGFSPFGAGDGSEME